MTSPDNNKNDAYSWINIIIIVSCIAVLVYSIYYFTSPNTPVLVDPQALDQALLDEDVADKQLQTAIIDNEADEVIATVAVISQAETTHPVISNLPLLEESDTLVLENVEQFSQQTLISDYLFTQGMLSSAVVFIDNFSRGDFIARFSLLHSPTQPFMVTKSDGKLFIDPRSYQRYDNYANYINSIDSQQFVQSYQTLKPLIDEAYQEISYPGSDFNDTLNNAIELLLTTPVLTYPIELKSPSVMYLYNDPALESLNDAQKFLLRMGPDNLLKMKKKLREIQSELAINE